MLLVTSTENVNNTTDFSSHNRPSATHGFNQRQRRAFIKRSQCHNIQISIKRPDIFTKTCEDDLIGNTESSNLLFKVWSQMTISYNDKTRALRRDFIFFGS